jgi:hypothetical protein
VRTLDESTDQHREVRFLLRQVILSEQRVNKQRLNKQEKKNFLQR